MKAASALDMDIGKLLDDNREALPSTNTSVDWFISRDGAALVRYFEALDRKERHAIIALAKALADRKS